MALLAMCDCGNEEGERVVLYEFLRKTRHFSSPRKKKRKRLERYGEVMNTSGPQSFLVAVDVDDNIFVKLLKPPK